MQNDINCAKKVQKRVGEKQSIREKSVKLHLPDMKKVKKKFFLADRIAPEKVIHVGESGFMSEHVISCWKVQFHVRCSESTKPDMKMHYGDMKL